MPNGEKWLITMQHDGNSEEETQCGSCLPFSESKTILTKHYLCAVYGISYICCHLIAFVWLVIRFHVEMPPQFVHATLRCDKEKSVYNASG